jgi:hypothetical protein
LKLFWKFHADLPLTKSFPQKIPICPAKIGYAIKDVPPKIKIIPLVDNFVILAKSQSGAAEHWRTGIFIEHHDHLPFDENDIGIFHDGLDLHVQLFTTLGQSIAHRLKVLNAFDLLNAVLEYNLVMIIWKNM